VKRSSQIWALPTQWQRQHPPALQSERSLKSQFGIFTTDARLVISPGMAGWNK
jgi:hypothetical protein